MTCILWSRCGNKPKTGLWRSWALHPTRWDSMPCYYSSLPIVFLILNYDYIACFPISLRCLDICCSCFVWFIDTIFSWLLLLCRWYMSNPHHMFVYLVGKTTQHHIEFTFMIHKVLVEILIYMHGSIYCGTWKELVKYMVMLYVTQICVRGVPPRSRVRFIDDGYKVEKRYMHVSCQFHKLLMPLHATWCSLKFPAICPPVVKCF